MRWADAGHRHPFTKPAAFAAGQTATAQSPASGALTKLALTFFTPDNAAGGDVTLDRYTVQPGWGGKWRIWAWQSFGANATGIREVSIFKNGARLCGRRAMPPTAAAPARVHTSTIAQLAVGDYLEVWFQQDSGGTLALGSQSDGTGFAGVWIAP